MYFTDLRDLNSQLSNYSNFVGTFVPMVYPPQLGYENAAELLLCIRSQHVVPRNYIKRGNWVDEEVLDNLHIDQLEQICRAPTSETHSVFVFNYRIDKGVKGFTTKHMKRILKDHGIKGFSKLRKKELVLKIEQHFGL
jgi:hypothetical protein